ncbi:MAG: hypothetical protein KDC35_00420 [Acidobacteria bacterium]|nr:hypothetical protein [Acidobacteriota bacterium]
MSHTFELCSNCYSTIDTRVKDEARWERCPLCQGIRCATCLDDPCLGCTASGMKRADLMAKKKAD